MTVNWLTLYQFGTPLFFNLLCGAGDAACDCITRTAQQV